MGIKGLTAIIAEHAPKAISEHEIKTLFGRKVAIDASMSIYQFLIAVRQNGELLTNDAGETTSHLMGLFYRTIRMVENGIKPAYVFDGKPPELKSGVLSKRFERREEAKEEGEEAKETGTTEDMDRFSRRTVRVTREHNAECQKLLGLMGIPYVVAPSEAEAQCAELARAGKVFAAGSEDMDTLTFGAPVLLRHLTFSEQRKTPISEIRLDKALEGLEMNMSQFTDLCLLLGCDYLEPIKGVGPKSALKLLREHGGLDEVLEHLREKEREKGEKADKAAGKAEKKKSKAKRTITSDDEESGSEQEEQEDEEKEKEQEKKVKTRRVGGISVPEEWPWKEAKELFLHPDVRPADELEIEWKNPDVEGLVQFMVREKGFSEERIRKGADKLTKFLGAKQQGRLDGFFSAPARKEETKGKGKGKAASSSSKDSKASKDKAAKGTKRKADEKEKGSSNKKTKK